MVLTLNSSSSLNPSVYDWHPLITRLLILSTVGEADLRPQYQRAKNVRAKTLSYLYPPKQSFIQKHYAIHSHTFRSMLFSSTMTLHL